MVSYGPRSLIKLGQTNVIEHQLTILHKIFNDPQIIIVVGYDANRIMNNTPDDIVKIENENYETTNVVRSIGMGLRACVNPSVLVLYGDLVFNEEALRWSYDKSSIVLTEGNDKESVGCITDNGYVSRLAFGLANPWAQIMFVMGKELRLLKKAAWNPEKYQLYGFEAINDIIDGGGKFLAHSPPNMKIVDIDSSRDIELAKEVV